MIAAEVAGRQWFPAPQSARPLGRVWAFLVVHFADIIIYILNRQ